MQQAVEKLDAIYDLLFGMLIVFVGIWFAGLFSHKNK